MPAPDATRLRAALDALIPDAGPWPSASQAVDADRVIAALDAADRAWLTALCAELAGPEAWPDLWRRVDADPAFARLRAALYDAYYASPATAPCLRALAEASPRDPDSRFDPALLDPIPKGP